ncbi:hypothetical protein [Burkholderia territorii]|uniref:hypothetical protein n=1 Tax=Burkholderia territorii TaxID=1503055 RepID=UPI000B175095
MPDFLANAGGISSCAREYRGEGDKMSVRAEVAQIHARVLQLAQRAHPARPPALPSTGLREK